MTGRSRKVDDDDDDDVEVSPGGHGDVCWCQMDVSGLQWAARRQSGRRVGGAKGRGLKGGVGRVS